MFAFPVQVGIFYTVLASAVEFFLAVNLIKLSVYYFDTSEDRFTA